MTDYIKHLIDARVDKCVAHVSKHKTERAYYAALNWLTGYIDALRDTHFIEESAWQSARRKFDEDTLGMVKYEAEVDFGKEEN